MVPLPPIAGELPPPMPPIGGTAAIGPGAVAVSGARPAIELGLGAGPGPSAGPGPGNGLGPTPGGEPTGGNPPPSGRPAVGGGPTGGKPPLGGGLMPGSGPNGGNPPVGGGPTGGGPTGPGDGPARTAGTDRRPPTDALPLIPLANAAGASAGCKRLLRQGCARQQSNRDNERERAHDTSYLADQQHVP